MIYIICIYIYILYTYQKLYGCLKLDYTHKTCSFLVANDDQPAKVGGYHVSGQTRVKSVENDWNMTRKHQQILEAEATSCPVKQKKAASEDFEAASPIIIYFWNKPLISSG